MPGSIQPVEPTTNWYDWAHEPTYAAAAYAAPRGSNSKPPSPTRNCKSHAKQSRGTFQQEPVNCLCEPQCPTGGEKAEEMINHRGDAFNQEENSDKEGWGV